MTSSPGDTRLATADSRPPVPLEVSRSRSFLVLKTRLAPAVISARIDANSGPRWSIIGRFMLRTTRSGSGVGPGIRSWVEKVIGRATSKGSGGEGDSELMLLRCVRKQGDRPCAFEGRGQRPLMPGTRPGDAAGQDLAPVADEPAQTGHLFV